MSDYTPTTDEVRDRYAWGRSDVEYGPDAEAEAEFDLWLAEHDATVRADHEKAVRERIAQDIEAFQAENEGDVLTQGAWSDGVRYGLGVGIDAARIAREAR